MLDDSKNSHSIQKREKVMTAILVVLTVACTMLEERKVQKIIKTWKKN